MAVALRWIDKTFYDDDYGGEALNDDEFSQYAAPAERIIDLLTYGKVSDLAQYDDSTQKQFKNAICAEIEYLHGMQETNEAQLGEIQSASIGGFSFTKAQDSANTGNRVQNMISQVAISYLYQSGLLYSGVDLL